MNNDKFSGLLGLCRKANKLSVGHDESKISVKSKKASLCLLAEDSSDRLKEEFKTLCEESSVTFIEVPYKIEQFAFIIGSKAAVITVNDDGFSKKLMTYREENV
ncbi:MAG: ribosomal L7Ae/L30e/S12e/Gadd45 family protein [Clostridiales bacterium]|nr:ribosomal L7Ae/L30e/S12e/Gadd45 family protein [Clostridiales bacterium]